MMNFDCFDQPFSSNRYSVMAHRGMVCTGSALASAAGLEMLRQGGNAIDAAVATAAEVKKLRRLTDALFMGVSSRIGAGGRLGEGPKRPGGAGADAIRRPMTRIFCPWGPKRHCPRWVIFA